MRKSAGLSVTCFTANLVAGGSVVTSEWQTCFRIDGAVLTDVFRCDNRTSGHSACCLAGEVCWSNGVCHGKNEGVDDWLRRGCTDYSWKDTSCFDVCPWYVGYTAIGVRPCDGIDKSNLYCCDDGTTGVGSFACCSNKSTTFNYDNITSLPTIIATMPLHDVATASPSSIATSASTDESIPTQSTASTCDVIFQGLKATSGGQTVKIVGNVPALGNWDTTKAVTLSASSYASNNPLWKATITLPAGQAIQYKYILVDADGSIIWEADPARTYHVAKSCANSTSPNVIPTESWNSSGSSLGSGDSSGGASRSASSSSSNQIALGVGLGVGLPATAAIIGGIWFAIWRSRRRQSAPQSGPQQEAPGDTASKSPTLQSPPVHSITPKPHELPSCYDARELPA